MALHNVRNASDTSVYKTLSSIFDFADEDQKQWWHSTAPMFADMLQASGYDIHSQYKHLGIYKKYIIPFLGFYPVDDDNRWLSILTRYGLPFELSLNCSDSLVRYTYEPINAATGTAKDPFNTHAIWDSLSKLQLLRKDIDLELFRHFKTDLTLNADESAYLLAHNLAGSEIKTQNKLALDLKHGDFVVKTYIYPALKALVTGRSIQDLMFDSVHRWSHQSPTLLNPLSVLSDYIQSRGPESTITPRLLSCDLIHPSKSRVKIYLLERTVSLPSLEDLWTLGGRLSDPSTTAGLLLVRELWSLLQMPSGVLSYPDPYLPLGSIPNEQLPLMANYTLHPNDPLPQPQVYFTTFGMNDMAVADALVTFFERRGWADMAASYKESLRGYYPHADHNALNYVHAYISFSYRNNRPYMSVYLHSFETGDYAITRLQAPEVNASVEIVS
ncbi:dimethylallyl tryptophan synthase FgaPT2 [Aspergillus steynii IBT 23096]|uniref:Dimethylallyl tryptophan synthase FgaPT2 n=1 Tax=Aspergillus steynii IBT 23096 TaxID=1392250 RepID=A0A2I2G2T0_9EURO|nr:dimethylallyl tryptophan synthase FgaPT2 [Aspergillus steynii IBT 23096]PLB47193.1 dimethylallyl tryptophan synthase FgaPT2 [Aspergillus steynii IBT 23096]